ncbi:MAG: glutathione binding-like protein, partial [Comamonas sp.]
FAGKEYEDKRPRDRYVAETQRLLQVLDQRLEGRDWIMGADYTIADIAILPWVRNLVGFYEAADLVGWERFGQLRRVLDKWQQRPAVQRGLEIPARG